jgi:hypothetical protein
LRHQNFPRRGRDRQASSSQGEKKADRFHGGSPAVLAGRCGSRRGLVLIEHNNNMILRR